MEMKRWRRGVGASVVAVSVMAHGSKVVIGKEMNRFKEVGVIRVLWE